MRTATTAAEVRQAVGAARAAGRAIGFVPTMGALHEGHLALVRASREAGCYTVMSIFVNPLQFGPGEDFDRYPRDPAGDAAKAAGAGVDLLFTPPVEELYPRPQRAFVEVTGLSDRLCGRSRPGHFRGVATVVAKLFHVVQPDRAFFGQKDAQQVAVLRAMVEDLCWPVELVAVPTVREADGVAMSSRNRYLGPRERTAARVLCRSLHAAASLLAAGERSAAPVLERMRAVLAGEPLYRPDYAELVDARTLDPVERVEGPVLLAVAGFIGTTRLIDNWPFDPERPSLPPLPPEG